MKMFAEIIKKYPRFVLLGVFIAAFSLGFGAHSFFLDRIIIERLNTLIDEGGQKIKKTLIDKKPANADFFPDTGDSYKTDALQSVVEPSTVATGENIIVVGNQPADSRVLLSMVSLGASGWVAIHEKNGEEGIGSVLGARRFTAGRHFAERIELLRGTESGQEYFAVLHRDNGDTVFDYVIETPLPDGEGSFIIASFFATEPE